MQKQTTKNTLLLLLFVSKCSKREKLQCDANSFNIYSLCGDAFSHESMASLRKKQLQQIFLFYYYYLLLSLIYILYTPRSHNKQTIMYVYII